MKQTTMRVWCKTDNIPDNQSGDSGLNPDTRIELDLVDNDTKRFNFNQIIKTYHTYKQSSKYVGRQLNFLIKDHKKVVGCIGFGSHVLPEPKAFKKYIGWGKEQFNFNFNKVANNWRFTLMDKNTCYGSKVLSLYNKVIPYYWKLIYGDKLVLLTTFVGGGHTGTVYKASNWIKIGVTAGWGGKRAYTYKDWKAGKVESRTDLFSHFSKGNIKEIFVKPLHRYWRRELLKEKNDEDKA